MEAPRGRIFSFFYFGKKLKLEEEIKCPISEDFSIFRGGDDGLGLGWGC